MGVKVREKVKGSGIWWLFIDHKGRRKAKRVGVGKEGQRAAKAAAERIQVRLALGDTATLAAEDEAVPTLREYAERWLAENLQARPSTLEQYRIRLEKRLYPHLGALPLTSITRERIKALITLEVTSHRAKGRRLAPKTVTAFMATLSAVLSGAVDVGLLPTNPAARWSRWARVSDPDRTEVEVLETFTPEELVQLFDFLSEQLADEYAFILTLARTGVRLGEAMALRWEDVDFNRRVILIRRSVRRGRRTVPKNGKARRVDMSGQLVETLRTRRSVMEAEAAVAGGALADVIFPRWTDGDQEGFRKLWRSVLKRAGLRYRKPHALRHTYASLLIQAGEPLTYVQEQLGHHSAAFTLAVYGHFIPRQDHRAVDRLDAPVRNPAATTAGSADDIVQEQSPLARHTVSMSEFSASYA